MPAVNWDEIMLGRVPREVVDLALQIGTSLETRDDTVWQNEQYGGIVETLMQQPNNTTALQIEFARLAAIAEVVIDSVSAVESSVIQVRTVNSTIVIRSQTEGLAIAVT